MARVALPESGIAARRRRRRALAALFIFLALLIVLGIMVALSWASFLRIKDIEVQGAWAVSSSSITAFVEQRISGRYFYLFAKDNILLYPKDQIASGLLAAYPTLKSADVHAEAPTKLSIGVKEREPTALWCGEVFEPSAPCFLLDDEGVAYAAGAVFSGDAYTRYYGTLATSSRQFLSSQKFKSLAALVGAIAQKVPADKVAGVVVDAAGDVHMSFASGFILLFSVQDESGDVFQRFTLALQSDAFTSHKVSDFEYLDLRFGDKLYYKLK